MVSGIKFLNGFQVLSGTPREWSLDLIYSSSTATTFKAEKTVLPDSSWMTASFYRPVTGPEEERESSQKTNTTCYIWRGGPPKIRQTASTSNIILVEYSLLTEGPRKSAEYIVLLMYSIVFNELINQHYQCLIRLFFEQTFCR